MAYRIEYSPDAEEHLRVLSALQRTTVLDVVDKQLVHQPALETRNRKPMRPNPMAPWELSIDDLRVYNEIEHEPEAVVYVRAVGVKRRNRVYIGREVIDL